MKKAYAFKDATPPEGMPTWRPFQPLPEGETYPPGLPYPTAIVNHGIRQIEAIRLSEIELARQRAVASAAETSEMSERERLERWSEREAALTEAEAAATRQLESRRAQFGRQAAETAEALREGRLRAAASRVHRLEAEHAAREHGASVRLDHLAEHIAATDTAEEGALGAQEEEWRVLAQQAEAQGERLARHEAYQPSAAEWEALARQSYGPGAALDETSRRLLARGLPAEEADRAQRAAAALEAASYRRTAQAVQAQAAPPPPAQARPPTRGKQAHPNEPPARPATSQGAPPPPALRARHHPAPAPSTSAAAAGRKPHLSRQPREQQLQRQQVSPPARPKTAGARARAHPEERQLKEALLEHALNTGEAWAPPVLPREGSPTEPGSARYRPQAHTPPPPEAGGAAVGGASLPIGSCGEVTPTDASLRSLHLLGLEPHLLEQLRDQAVAGRLSAERAGAEVMSAAELAAAGQLDGLDDFGAARPGEAGEVSDAELQAELEALEAEVAAEAEEPVAPQTGGSAGSAGHGGDELGALRLSGLDTGLLNRLKDVAREGRDSGLAAPPPRFSEVSLQSAEAAEAAEAATLAEVEAAAAEAEAASAAEAGEERGEAASATTAAIEQQYADHDAWVESLKSSAEEAARAQQERTARAAAAGGSSSDENAA